MTRGRRRRGMGELEAGVMDVLWDVGGWLTPGDVHERLDGSPPVAYTTIMTILVRLWNKDRLRRERVGRAYAYRPTLSREEDAARRMREVLATVSDHSGTLGRFVASLEDGDQADLRRLLSGARKPRR